jgi:FkbM family methyltransferase
MLYSEIQIIRNLFKNNINGVIHVGAHDGSCVKSYLKIGIKNILLFEPQKNLYKKIKKKFYFNLFNINIIKKNYALSNYSGKSLFNLNSNDQCSSLKELGKHKIIYKDFIVKKKIVVPVRTLYDFLKKKFKDYNFLNIDAQGSELDILRGAKNLIRQFDIIYLEVNFDYLYKKSPLVYKIDNYLKKYDYKRIYTITPYHPTWGDAIYIKKEISFDN